MFLHGTPGSLADTIWRLPDLQHSGFGVLAIDYRGYGASTGTPTEAGFAADARAVRSREMTESANLAEPDPLAEPASAFARAAEAEAAGADTVGSDDLVARIQGGWLDFDAAIATPDQMAKIGRIARILGPRGLMPNPKTGTVTMDVTKAVSDIKGGKITFRVDKHSNLHLIIGKASFSPEQLVDNYAVALDEVLRSKPSAAKGKYLRKVAVATTMGPGVQIDPNVIKNVHEAVTAES